MRTSDIRILGVMLKDRKSQSLSVQTVLTTYGCTIKTRLGLNDISSQSNAGCALMILELTGDVAEMDRLEHDLNKLDKVEVKKIIFDL